MTQAVTLRKEVKLVWRDCGGVFLIDLKGDTFAISAEDATVLREIVSQGRELVTPWDLCGLPAQLAEAGLLQSENSSPSRGSGLRYLLRIITLMAYGPARAACLVVCAHILLKYFSWYDVASIWTTSFRPTCKSSPRRCRSKLGTEAQRAIANSLFSVRCKERSLVAFALATREGYCPELVVGCAQPCLELHCWTEVLGRVLGDDEERCRELIEIHRFRTCNSGEQK